MESIKLQTTDRQTDSFTHSFTHSLKPLVPASARNKELRFIGLGWVWNWMYEPRITGEEGVSHRLATYLIFHREYCRIQQFQLFDVLLPDGVQLDPRGQLGLF